jgi:hypothetical protein
MTGNTIYLSILPLNVNGPMPLSKNIEEQIGLKNMT